MQVMLTNRSPVQFPLLITKGGLWSTLMLQPGIEQTLAGDDVTNLLMGKVVPGTSPADIDSAKAKITFLAGIAAMEGRSDIAAAQKITPLRLFIESFDGTMSVDGGAGVIATLNKGDRQEVVSTSFMLTVA